MQIPDIRCRQSGILLRAGPLANRHLGFPELNVNYLLLCSRNGSIVKLLQIRRYPPFSIALHPRLSFSRSTTVFSFFFFFFFFAAARARIARRRSEKGGGRVNNKREGDGGRDLLASGKNGGKSPTFLRQQFPSSRRTYRRLAGGQRWAAGGVH